jgi:tRNA A37 threonylcarbamoyladenosine synthetase subunit TsaC/SUA5/YrdC
MRSKLPEMENKFQNSVREYNKYARTYYQRLFWRNLWPEEFVHYSSLQEILISWAYKEGRINDDQKEALKEFLQDKQFSNPVTKRELKLFKPHDIDEIVDALLNGDLAVIPNGKIYVIVGIDDEGSTNRTTIKINREKLRHPLMPVVRLSFSDSIPYKNVRDPNVKNFLDQLVRKLHPIGLLLPNKLGGKYLLYVFYGNGFFRALREKIEDKARKKCNIYVSSANITTTGANTTVEGVLRDFSLSTFIVGVLDAGDLKGKSIHADSSTIIKCSASGNLTYYRIGYPSKEEIDRFAKSLAIKIKEVSETRYTFSR